MDLQSRKKKVLKAECLFIKKFGLIIMLLVIAVVAVLNNYFWAWVQLSCPAGFTVDKCLNTSCIIMVLGLITAISLWPLSLRWMKNKHALIWNVCISILCVLSVEFVVRMAYFQSPFWLAVRARAGIHDYYIRELAYIRLEAMDKSLSSETNAVVLVGSSQVLNAVDAVLLSSLIKPMSVKRRALYGMTPIKALAAKHYLSIDEGNTVFQYLSSFDFVNQDPYPINWMRPLIVGESFMDVIRCHNVMTNVENWRNIVDLSLSSQFELWRIRDYVRQITMNFMGASSLTTKQERAEKGDSYQQNTNGIDLFEQKAFITLTEYFCDKHANSLIFEGQVNILRQTEQTKENDIIISSWIQSLQNELCETPINYVSLENQCLIPDSYWEDTIHLNSTGRYAFTHYLADYFLYEYQCK